MNIASKIIIPKSIVIIVFLISMMSVFLFSFFYTVQALAPQKTASDFPNSATYDLINKKAKEIAVDLCKKDSNKTDCQDGYKREYLYLAFLTCDTESSKTKQISCYKEFEKNNDKLGKAREAAGFPANQRVDANTPKGSNLVSKGLDGRGTKTDQCGKGDNAIKTKFNFGCVGNAYKGSTLNPIMDFLYTIIRFLSTGVGIVLVGSIIWAGIQYSSSQGNPEQTQAAKNRIQNAIVGLVLYMFIYALVQYLVPGGLFT